MRHTSRLAALAGATVTVTVTVTVAALCLPAVAGADELGHGHGGSRAPVYVLTNDPAGNQVVTYVPDDHGTLHEVGRRDTGGLGTTISGAVVDPLASQGGLVAAPSEGLLVAVNGGSDTISVFRASGSFVSTPRVVGSEGSTPVSVAVRGDVLYVLDAGGAGSIQGFFADSLAPIPGSHQSLGLTPNVAPLFLHTPGQIGFTPDGRHLVVTTKASGSAIDVFNVTPWGSVTGAPVVNRSAMPVPFGFTFDRSGRLAVTEAGTSALTTYAVAADGTLSEQGSTATGAKALCWVATDGTFFFGANAGSASVTTYTVGSTGTPAAVASTTTDAGPVDLAASPDGRSLYVETGSSDLVDSFAVQADGSLVATGSVAPELPGHVGLEGIAVGIAD